MKTENHVKYYLSTEGYYFIYRPDKYDESIRRAVLFDDLGNQVHGVKVNDRGHFSIINEFEVLVNIKP